MPEDKKRLVDEVYKIFEWDSCSPEQRRSLATQEDAQNPTTLVEKEEAEAGFLEGYRSISIPKKNRKNAKKTRPTRQKVTDSEILTVMNELIAEGVKPHNQCSEARKRLMAKYSFTISLRGFRKRWNKVISLKKGT